VPSHTLIPTHTKPTNNHQTPQHGYVETLLGRRRYLPGIHSAEAGERAQAERQAVNSVCQGSAADLIKLAMVNIHHELARGALGPPGEGEGLACVDKACRLVLQVHDELVYEVKEELIQPAVELVRRCMEGAVRLRVPLRVKVHVGRSWGALASGETGAAGDGGLVV
jgi:DNA polymerase theta